MGAYHIQSCTKTFHFYDDLHWFKALRSLLKDGICGENSSHMHCFSVFLQCCLLEGAGTYSYFDQMLKDLESCFKRLSSYLDSRRSVFPRLHFVSDQVLLKILSGSDYVESVKPHLRSAESNVSINSQELASAVICCHVLSCAVICYHLLSSATPGKNDSQLQMFMTNETYRLLFSF